MATMFVTEQNERTQKKDSLVIFQKFSPSKSHKKLKAEFTIYSFNLQFTLWEVFYVY